MQERYRAITSGWSRMPTGRSGRRRCLLGRWHRHRALRQDVRVVERHIDNLYGKLGARGRADAVAVALRHGLEPAEGPGTG